MSILSLFSIRNSVEEGFMLAGYDVASDVTNAIGIVGPNNRRLVNSIKAVPPLFFVALSDRNKKVDIEGYIITTHISTTIEYSCSRNIVWIIGVHDNNALNIPFEFPFDTNDTYEAIHPDTALALAIACNITDAVDAMAIMSEYDKYYGFSPFNE